MPIVYIAVGSNQGDRHENIEGARSRLGQSGAHTRRVSPLYETQAVVKQGIPTGIPRNPSANPPFLNGVFEVETDLQPERLLDLLETIERDLGRTGKGDWSPRPIDLDILLYDDLVIRSPRLTIPHPEMARRWFVLKPLADLAPDVVHPVLNRTIKEILWNFSSTPPT
jgi:2-amino-4-hydroxy-6-hydroxymethyldihydropteridine diphosphokinase